MENAHVIQLRRWNFESPEIFDDWNKWSKASRTPLSMSSGAMLGVERAFSLKEKSVYANSITIAYFKNLENFVIQSHSTQVEAVKRDTEATWGEKIESSWQTVFLLVRRFKGAQAVETDEGHVVDKTTRLKEFPEGSEPIILLRGLRFSTDEWKQYDSWVNEWGNDVYIPMLLKVPGLTEYSRFWLSPISSLGSPSPEIIENPDYPQDLSIIHFENLQAYQNFLKSKELAVFDKTLAAAFPTSINYKWNVAFRLARRWSR